MRIYDLAKALAAGFQVFDARPPGYEPGTMLLRRQNHNGLWEMAILCSR